MQNMIFPAGYRPVLDIFETQRAIKIVKDTFERVLAAALNLERVTAPVIVRADSGINDDLNGVERKVHFTMKEIGGEAEVVQSLAKWKRMALMRYNFRVGKGLYTDMSAMRTICIPSMSTSGTGRRSSRATSARRIISAPR